MLIFCEKCMRAPVKCIENKISLDDCIINHVLAPVQDPVTGNDALEILNTWLVLCNQIILAQAQSFPFCEVIRWTMRIVDRNTPGVVYKDIPARVCPVFHWHIIDEKYPAFLCGEVDGSVPGFYGASGQGPALGPQTPIFLLWYRSLPPSGLCRMPQPRELLQLRQYHLPVLAQQEFPTPPLRAKRTAARIIRLMTLLRISYLPDLLKKIPEWDVYPT